MNGLNKGFIIKLTVAVYKITDLLPEGECLGDFIREKADELLSDFITILTIVDFNLKNTDKDEVIDKMVINWEVLASYFEIAKSQNWIKEANFEILSDEYQRIIEKLKILAVEEEESEGDKKEEKSNKSISENVVKIGKLKTAIKKKIIKFDNNRHNRIVDILKNKGAVQVKDVKEFFPQLSKRTLRRDFEYLLSKGVVQRIGDGNMTEYKLKA